MVTGHKDWPVSACPKKLGFLFCYFSNKSSISKAETVSSPQPWEKTKGHKDFAVIFFIESPKILPQNSTFIS